VAVPTGLDHARHLALDGRGGHPTVRRLFLALLGVLVVVALAGLIGQRPTTSRASTAAATLTVESPATLRGGLLFTARYTVQAHRRIVHPTLVLAHGWFDDEAGTAYAPSPIASSSRDGQVRFVFPTLAAGHSATYWIAFQVVPTNVGRHDEDVALEDGSGTQLAFVHRTLTVLP
jgi:hypothetical protein